MGLTRDFKVTVVARVERDPAFAKELLDEATTLLISGEAEMARVILRDLVNATLGFEQLAKLTSVPSKSLHRMLYPKGNLDASAICLPHGPRCRVAEMHREGRWLS